MLAARRSQGCAYYSGNAIFGGFAHFLSSSFFVHFDIGGI